ncbi:MAG TPA: hypothetical protein VFC04_02480 [Actinomycetota bacterium]|nr:hypothetical protein [Actinomycetota bacterium]
MDAPRLRRGVFGYSRRSVRIALAERDARILAAAEREREALARAGELESRLAGLEALALELQAEARVMLEGLEAETGRRLEAEDANDRREGVHDLLRAELAAARRAFLREHERAEAARARAAALEAGSLVVLPDLEAVSGNGSGSPEELARR